MAVAVALLIGGCAADAPSADAPSSAPASDRSPSVTERLDSMAVIGHSGATGTLSDPENPMRDAGENSWATGDNPQVQSLYLRLLADHPALEGHNYNQAVNGTGVDDLPSQFADLLAHADPLPDLILVQTIDNDMHCDGSDPNNYRPYGQALDRMLSRMEKAIPRVQLFIVSQWADVKTWATWAARHPVLVRGNAGDGPCDVFTVDGHPRPEGIRSLQEIVDGYWAQVEAVCAAHRGCFTDQGAEQTQFVPADRDVASDLNHLSIWGHRKFADIAWRALPSEIKQRP